LKAESVVTANILYASSNRTCGNMSLSYGPTQGALDNRKNFLSRLGIDYQDLVCAKQIHSANVKLVKQQDKGKGAMSYEGAIADTDALITDQKNLPLAIFTADCLAISLYDPMHPACGIVHAGWRSAKEGILKKALEAMQKEFGSSPERMLLRLGPAIRSCCYEVGKEFTGFFPEALEQRDSRFYLDLIAANTKQALSLGVDARNISDCLVCTSCRNKEFFSFRREKEQAGRTMSVVMLK